MLSYSLNLIFSHMVQLASWEEGIAQARTACEAWRREADDANRKCKLAEQTKEEVRMLLKSLVLISTLSDKIV